MAALGGKVSLYKTLGAQLAFIKIAPSDCGRVLQQQEQIKKYKTL